MATSSHLEGVSVPAAILIGSVIIAGSIVYASARIGVSSAVVTSAQIQDQAPQIQTPQRAANISAVKTANEPIVGAATAPIEIAYWYDYQCPVCRGFEEQVMPQLKRDYIDTGKIRIVYKDLQFLGPDSTSLGLVSRAVWQLAPDKFAAWHKAVYDNQGEEHSGWATKDKILSITTSVIGADLAKKAMALADSNAAAYRQSMDADRSEGAAFGVKATPSMIVGNKLLIGLYPYETVKAAIDAALKK